jgi:hypothetical protein
MAKTIFEEMGVTFHQEGDYFIPNLVLPTEKERPVGVWGQRHKRYLRQSQRVRYVNLLTSGKLNSYLADINERAEDMFSRLVQQMSEKQSVTEKLKAESQMRWVGMMNNIRSSAMEIVINELIYK